MQGLAPCSGCMDRCYQCASSGIAPGENCALAWDLGEIYGLADPSRLPSPTTRSLARTVIMRPEAGTIGRLHIEDAKRAQGLPPGYTSVPGIQDGSCSAKAVLKTRFRCVGNALPGEVRLPAAVLPRCDLALAESGLCARRCLARSFSEWHTYVISPPDWQLQTVWRWRTACSQAWCRLQSRQELSPRRAFT
jgi:hypothetical protein